MAAVTAATVVARVRRARWTTRELTGAEPCVLSDDGVRLHVEVDGPDHAPLTVVLAHGFGADGAMFDPQWAALRGHARLVRYDQRGHGRSGWAGGGSATPARLGRDLGRVIDELGGAGPMVVVGHSMGGMALLACARERPALFGSRIAGVALLSTLAGPLATAGRDPGGLVGMSRIAVPRAAAWMLWLLSPLIAATHPFRTDLGRRILRRRLFAADPPGEVVQDMTDGWVQTPIAVMSAYLPGLARYDQREVLGTLCAVPVLVLAGTADTAIPASAAERLAADIGPAARLVLVPDAGHMVNLTHPAPVNEALLDLLAHVRSGADEWSTS